MSDSPSNVDTPNSVEETYPTQRHAGQVGYGPNYHTGPTLTDKLAGHVEELRGKITHKPQLVQEGHDRATGEARRRQQLGLDDESPFAAQQQPQSPKPETGDSPNELKSTVSSQGEEKSTTAPEIDM